MGDFKVYGDYDTAVVLMCWDCHRQWEWSEGVDLDDLNRAAATHYWEVHGD